MAFRPQRIKEVWSLEGYMIVPVMRNLPTSAVSGVSTTPRKKLAVVYHLSYTEELPSAVFECNPQEFPASSLI